MNKVIEAIKAETLRQIRTNRPQKNSEGLYVCQHCGDNNSDRGFQFWHKCAGRDSFGITLRVVAKTV